MNNSVHPPRSDEANRGKSNIDVQIDFPPVCIPNFLQNEFGEIICILILYPMFLIVLVIHLGASCVPRGSAHYLVIVPEYGVHILVTATHGRRLLRVRLRTLPTQTHNYQHILLIMLCPAPSPRLLNMVYHLQYPEQNRVPSQTPT